MNQQELNEYRADQLQRAESDYKSGIITRSELERKQKEIARSGI